MPINNPMKNEVNITNILKVFDEKFDYFMPACGFNEDNTPISLGVDIKLFLQEQIRLVVESCPIREFRSSAHELENARRNGWNQKCAEIKKWKESLLE